MPGSLLELLDQSRSLRLGSGISATKRRRDDENSLTAPLMYATNRSASSLSRPRSATMRSKDSDAGFTAPVIHANHASASSASRPLEWLTAQRERTLICSSKDDSADARGVREAADDTRPVKCRRSMIDELHHAASSSSRLLEWLNDQQDHTLIDSNEEKSVDSNCTIGAAAGSRPGQNSHQPGDGQASGSKASASSGGTGMANASSNAGEIVASFGPWSCEIRRARLEDTAAIVAAPGQFFDEEITPTREDLSRMSNLHVLVISSASASCEMRRAHQIAGYVSWECRAGKAELVALAVRVGFRRLGLATQLLILAIRASLKGGAEKVELQVRPGNVAARALYESHGFENVSIIPKYYGGGRHPGILMRLLLSADVARISMQMSELAERSRCVTGYIAGIQVSAGSYHSWTMLARAAVQAAPAVAQRDWPLREVLEMPLQAMDRCGYDLRGYNPGDGRVLVSVKRCGRGGVGVEVAPYREVLATLLHELVHFVHLGHGPEFYRELGALFRDAAGEEGLEEYRRCTEVKGGKLREAFCRSYGGTCTVQTTGH